MPRRRSPSMSCSRYIEADLIRHELKMDVAMVLVDPERQREYREAWEAWQRQLQRLHEVFLDGEPLEPPKLKGLLNREARAKERYDAAREALLGIGGLPAAPTSSRIGRVAGGSIHSP